jgi:hypothetical protein
MGYHLSVAPAVGAGGAHGKETLVTGHLTAAATELTGFRLGSGFTAIALAGLAGVHLLEGQLFFHTEGGFQKAQRKVVAQVGAPLMLAPGTASGTQTEKILKYIAKAGKDVLET